MNLEQCESMGVAMQQFLLTPFHDLLDSSWEFRVNFSMRHNSFQHAPTMNIAHTNGNISDNITNVNNVLKFSTNAKKHSNNCK